MAQIHAVILPAKALRNGRHKIRISVSHNGQTRYIVTNILIDSSKEFKNGSIVRRPDAAFLNTKLRSILQNYQEALEDIPYASGLSCPEIVELLKDSGRYKHLSLQLAFEDLLKIKDAKESSIKTYHFAWNCIISYIDKNLAVENVTRTTVRKLHNSFVERHISNSTIMLRMALFRSVINHVVKQGFVTFKRDPFFGYKLPKYEIRDMWLSTNEIKKIRDLKIKKNHIAKIRDLFILSYYLGGINMIDLLDIRFDKKSSRSIKYIRSKTNRQIKPNKFIEFTIPDEAWPIIEKYTDESGRIIATKSQYKDKMSGQLRIGCKEIAQMAGIPRLIYYAARKSFSQHAFDLGINTTVIDYILGHKIDGGSSSLYHYIYVTPKMATEAIRKVLDNLK